MPSAESGSLFGHGEVVGTIGSKRGEDAGFKLVPGQQPGRFHDALLANGTVPLWLHRALMLGEQNGEML